MDEEKHCGTCDCHETLCGIKRHKVVKFLQRWAFFPFTFVCVAILAFHIDKVLNEKSIPLYWMLIVALTVNWIWIFTALIIPCIEDIKIVAEGCAGWLLDIATHCYRCLCFFCLYCYNERRTRGRTADQSTCYTLEHVVAESPGASRERYSNENPPPLPEKQGSLVDKKESPVVYDLPPKFKRQPPSTTDYENSPTKADQDAALSDTLSQTSHTSGATGTRNKTGHTGGATGSNKRTGHTSGTVRKIDQSGRATSVRPKTSPTPSNLSVRVKASPTSSNSGDIAKTSQTSRNLGDILNISPTSSNLSVIHKNSPNTLKTSPTASSFGTSPEASPSGVSLGKKPNAIRCLFPDSKSNLLSTSFGKTIDETEDVDDSICQLDLSHISVPISLPSSAIADHSVYDPYEKDPSRNTEQLRNNPQEFSSGATHVATGSRAEQSVSSYIPFVPDTQLQNPKTFKFPDPTHLKDSKNMDNSILQSNLSQIGVPISLNAQSSSPIQESNEIKKQFLDTKQMRKSPQVSPSDPPRVRMSPRVSPHDPPRVRMSSRVSPYDPPRGRMSPQVSPDDPPRGRMSPQVSPYDPPRVRMSPQVSPYDPPRVRRSPQVSPSDPPRMRMSPQVSPSDPPRVRMSPQVSPSDPPRVLLSPRTSPSYLPQERNSPLALHGDRTNPVRISPEVSVSDPKRLRTSPKILFDPEKARSSPEAAGVRQSQSSYVPFVPDTKQQNIPPLVILHDSDRPNTPHIQTNIISEHHETNLFTSSFGKTTDLTENIDDSILQLDASHIDVPILRTEQASIPQAVESKFTSHATTSSSPHLKTSPLTSAPGSPHLKTSPLASSPGSPHLKTSTLVSSPGSPHLKTIPHASAPDSPYLKISSNATAPDSPYLKISPQASEPDSSYLKMKSQTSAPDSSYLKTNPQPSAPGSPQKTSPLVNTSGSPVSRSSPLTPALSSIQRMSPQTSESSFVHLKTSHQASTHPSTSPQRSSGYVACVPNQPGPPQGIPLRDLKLDQSDVLLRSSTEEHSVNIRSNREDEKPSIGNFADKEGPEIFNFGQKVLERDARGVQMISDGENKDTTRAYTKFSIPSQANSRIENNSVQVIDEGQSSCLSSFGSSDCNDRNDLQESKLRRRIRTSSEKCEIKKSASESVTTRSKTF